MPIIEDVLKEIKEISPIEDILATGLSRVLLTGSVGAWMLGSAFSVGDAGNPKGLGIMVFLIIYTLLLIPPQAHLRYYIQCPHVEGHYL